MQNRAREEMVQSAIWEAYAPRTPDGEIREDVLWVGPLFNGLAYLLPEMFKPTAEQDTRRMPNSKGGRMGVKLFFMDVARPRTIAGEVRGSLWMQREEWGRDEKGGIKTLYFTSGDKIINGEPGGMRNSVEVVEDVMSGSLSMRDPSTQQPTLPQILVDVRYGLHYLLRDDFFHFEWLNRHKDRVVREFRLRKPSEGSSEVSAANNPQVMSF